jgi:predicted ArsR family transcriptional regulator
MSTMNSPELTALSRDLAAPSATHQRILRVLGMTQRPLKSGELEMALGMFTNEARSACQWLTDNGYIERTVRIGRAAAQRAMTFWSLADKGRLWAKDQDALVA